MKVYFLSVGRLVLLVAFLYSCGSNSVFEAKKDFKKNRWPKTEPVLFDFKIEDASADYDLAYFVRNSLDYPYQNIYLQYYLEDSVGNILSKNLNNVELFNSKTGKPLGDGLGDTYDLEKTFLNNFRFPEPGSYRLRIDQYMRQDTLEHIHSIGFVVRKNPKEIE